MPNLFEYVRKTLLNEDVIWTKICHKNVVTEKSVSTLGKNFTINNTSNATSENFFKFIKSDKNLLKTPLVTFIETVSDRIRNLEKEYVNGIISYDNKDFTEAERKKIERLITTEHKVEKEKWGDKRQTKKSKVNHISYLIKPKLTVVFSTPKAVTAKKVKEEKSNGVSLKSAFINCRKHYWKDVAAASPTMKICQKTIVNQWNSLTEEEQLSYKAREVKESNIRQYCCGRDIKNSFMVACDICDDWLHVNCINYSTSLATVAITYVCQRCINDNFLGLINFLHYQIKKKAWNDYEIKNAIVLYQNMALEETLAFQLHNFISDSCNLNEKVIVHSQQGMKNEYYNCWFSATIQVLLGTIIQEPLPKIVHSDDPMILQSLISFSEIEVSIDLQE